MNVGIQLLSLNAERYPNFPPRALALHLYHAYMRVLACKEAMWEELLYLRNAGEKHRAELALCGWDEDEPEEDRFKFDMAVKQYEEDMHARTSFVDALESLLAWEPPKKAPLTKAEMALELDKERERVLARRAEAQGPALMDGMVVCRSLRMWCGFKDGKWEKSAEVFESSEARQ